MKKIAIINCLNANDVCAGVGCLAALDARSAHFARYAGEEVKLCAFMRCSRCGVDPEDDRGMMEKLERLVKCGVECAHIGVCAQRRDGTTCPHMEKTAQWLQSHNIEVIWGTHG